MDYILVTDVICEMSSVSNHNTETIGLPLLVSSLKDKINFIYPQKLGIFVFWPPKMKHNLRHVLNEVE